MLTLTRRTGESSFIYPSNDLPADMTIAELFGNEKIEIKVIETSNHKLRIKIDAPKKLEIMRNELMI